jgi:hypothetical protein
MANAPAASLYTCSFCYTPPAALYSCSSFSLKLLLLPFTAALEALKDFTAALLVFFWFLPLLWCQQFLCRHRCPDIWNSGFVMLCGIIFQISHDVWQGHFFNLECMRSFKRLRLPCYSCCSFCSFRMLYRFGFICSPLGSAYAASTV